MKNFRKIKLFTDCLYELVVTQKVQLTIAIEILSANKDSVIKKACSEILEDLEAGQSFSNALSKNSTIKFENTYIAFIHFAEKTGELEKILEFIRVKCERHEKACEKIISAALYPILVIFLAFFSCGLLYLYGNQLFGMDGMFTFEMKLQLVFYVAGMCLLGGLFFLIIKKLLSDDLLYEAFLAMDFLCKSGYGINLAISYGRIITGFNTRYGEMLLVVQKKIESGNSLYEAFNWHNKLSEALFFANKTGADSMIFERVCRFIEVKNERLRSMCLSIIEPLFIVITGLFLFVLVLNFMLPVISNSLNLL